MGTGQELCSICWAVTVRRWPISSGASPTSWAFATVFTSSVGQVYPRSLDHDVVSALVRLGAGPSPLHGSD